MKHFYLYAASVLSTCSVIPSMTLAQADEIPFSEIAVYDSSDFNREVTLCDRLASHPSDPERVTDGVSRSEMDKPAAIKACANAVSNDPENPRLNYQLARAYGYSGRHAEGDSYRDRALQAGYPQSLFVVGYIRLEGWDGRGKNPCYGGELIRRSAHAGRFAGLVGFPHYVLTGHFDECSAYPKVNKSELTEFLVQAERRADGYYQRVLVTQLKHDLKSFEP